MLVSRLVIHFYFAAVIKAADINCTFFVSHVQDEKLCCWNHVEAKTCSCVSKDVAEGIAE